MNVHENTREVKKRISKAFRELRKIGIIAKQNFWCCQSCGTSAICDEVDSGEKRGYVFYHNQDNTGLNETGQVYLSYSDLEIGKLIAQELTKAGLIVDWNYNESTRILVSGILER